MFRHWRFVIVAWSLLFCGRIGIAEELSLTETLEKAIYTEQTVGDLDAAIELYEKIASQHEVNSDVAARAQLHLGMARLKRGDRAKASEAFRILVDKYPGKNTIIKHAENMMPPDLDEALNQIRQNYVDAVEDEDKLMAAAIRGVLGELDEYSDFISAETLKEFQITLAGELVGIGVAIKLEDGHLVVTSPIVGSPAFKAGLLAGDTITTVDGVPVASFPEEERLKEAVRRLRGKADTAVMVGILSRNLGVAKEIQIIRQPLKLESITGRERSEAETWSYTLSEEPTISYLAIHSFTRSTADDLKQIVSTLEREGTEALIIDVRNSPGGMLQAAIDCADIFLDDCVVVDVKGRNNNRSYRAKDGQLLKGIPIAIITNSMTASAAEIFTGAMRDHGRAVIVGERTFGKRSVQNLYRLQSGNAIKLTTARFYLPNGSNLQKPISPGEGDKWGVDPTEGFEVTLTDDEARQFGPFRAAQSIIGEKDVPEFVDRALKKAVEYLEKTLAE